MKTNASNVALDLFLENDLYRANCGRYLRYYERYSLIVRLYVAIVYDYFGQACVPNLCALLSAPSEADGPIAELKL